MSEENKNSANYRKVIKLLESQYQSLADAGSNKNVLKMYSAVLIHLKKLPNDKIVDLQVKPQKTAKKKIDQSLPPLETAFMSLEEVIKLVSEETISRKVLEKVAIGRFQVPSGSMRSYSNIQKLREKIMTLVRNEQAHQTIFSVAKKERN